MGITEPATGLIVGVEVGIAVGASVGVALGTTDGVQVKVGFGVAVLGLDTVGVRLCVTGGETTAVEVVDADVVGVPVIVSDPIGVIVAVDVRVADPDTVPVAEGLVVAMPVTVPVTDGLVELIAVAVSVVDGLVETMVVAVSVAAGLVDATTVGVSVGVVVGARVTTVVGDSGIDVRLGVEVDVDAAAVVAVAVDAGVTVDAGVEFGTAVFPDAGVAVAVGIEGVIEEGVPWGVELTPTVWIGVDWAVGAFVVGTGVFAAGTEVLDEVGGTGLTPPPPTGVGEEVEVVEGVLVAALAIVVENRHTARRMAIASRPSKPTDRQSGAPEPGSVNIRA